MARHNLSEAGRLRCGQAGNVNLQRWHNGETPEGALELEREVEAVRTQLEERAAPISEPARTFLIRSAIAQFIKIALTERKLLRSSRLSAKAPLDGDDLAPLSSNLLRTLRALGVIDGTGAEEEDQTLEAYIASKSQDA